MKNLIFISYRRDDTAPIARALAETLQYRLWGQGLLGLDSVLDGEVWPDTPPLIR